MGLLRKEDQESAVNMFSMWESRDGEAAGFKGDKLVMEKSMSINADN